MLATREDIVIGNLTPRISGRLKNDIVNLALRQISIEPILRVGEQNKNNSLKF
jgi:hypothetical protein